MPKYKLKSLPDLDRHIADFCNYLANDKIKEKETFITGRICILATYLSSELAAHLALEIKVSGFETDGWETADFAAKPWESPIW